MTQKESRTWKACERDRAYEWLKARRIKGDDVDQMIEQVIRECSQIAFTADTNWDAREKILTRFGLTL